jgi:ribosomal protein S5
LAKSARSGTSGNGKGNEKRRDMAIVKSLEQSKRYITEVQIKPITV